MAKKAKGTGGKSWPPPKGEGPPTTPGGICRLRVFYSGNVQGVGMRATIANVAPNFSIAGWVRNTSDARVEMLAEGKQEDMERFLAAIGDEMSTYIKSVARTWEPPTEEFKAFSIAT